VTSHDTDDRGRAAAQLATRLIQRANREFSRIRALPYERLPPVKRSGWPTTSCCGVIPTRQRGATTPAALRSGVVDARRYRRSDPRLQRVQNAGPLRPVLVLHLAARQPL